MIKTYFLTELKKGICLTGQALKSTLLILLLVSGGMLLISQTISKSVVMEPLQVGVVISDENVQSKLISQFAASVDSVRSICNFEYFYAQEALAKMKKGDLQAVIQLPDNFYQDVYTGVNTPAVLYIPADSTLTEKTFQELLRSGVSVLQTAESAVYTTLDLAGEQELLAPKEQLGDIIASLYIDLALSRNNIFGESVLSSVGNLSLSEYYFASGMVVFLLLSGLNYGYFYNQQSKAVEQKLRLYQMTGWKTGLVKTTVMSILLWISSLILYFVGILISSLSKKEFLDFRMEAVPCLLVVCFGIAALFHFIYQLTREGIQGSLILLLTLTGMIIASGTVIPIAYLPETVARIGAYLPVNYWIREVAQVLFDAPMFAELAIGIGIGCFEFALGELAGWKKS